MGLKEYFNALMQGISFATEKIMKRESGIFIKILSGGIISI